MDVYRQAAEVIRMVREGKGTAKALCLRKEMQKKRQTYAVVCETLRHYELLEDVLAVAEFFKYYPQANKEFALCMAYDVVKGKGVNTQNDSTARAITQSASYLREAFWSVEKHHTIVPRDNFESWEEGGAADAAAAGATVEVDADVENAKKRSAGNMLLPRYARINTLRIEEEKMIAILRSATASGAAAAAAAAESLTAAKGSKKVKKLDQEEEEEAEEAPEAEASAAAQSQGSKSRRRRRTLPDFHLDPVVPSLLVFPPGTDLHAHPAVRRGQLVLQDRASCLPACVLLGAVPCVAEAVALPPTPEYVIDACAAPGNKTTQLAALGAASGVKIMATERDARRAELLQRRVQSLGAADAVNVVNMDFFDLSSDDRAATQAILLDPSCSASGVVTRVDVALMNQHGVKRARGEAADGAPGQHKRQRAEESEGQENEQEEAETEAEAPLGNVNPDSQSNAFSSNEDRVTRLSRLQRKLLAHALLSFDNCATVVYSTCSVHEAENEGVVREVLSDSRVAARGWRLTNIMPGTWRTRGRRAAQDTLPLDYTIRCDPAVDRTNGFYVARFDRAVPTAKTE